MFYYIDGTVTIIEPNLAVVDAGGVGYACSVSAATLSRLEIGKRARLYTFCNIKEDAFDIYGFFDAGEKRAFTMLIGVTGVGPRAALSILSVCSPESLAFAVVGDDTALITQAVGVGKKLAQRIVLELKDKVLKNSAELSASGYVPPSSLNTAASEAAQALAVLEYSQSEIASLLRGIDVENLTREEIIRAALNKTAKTLK
ncbi:MAG: Holliday junction branch migration protein RuvA [Oscillospiraceae bacterium]|jgi:Holliday junction DNA helicase RuvA|nr:Holliday junction branch migration protein RuvA [Oscillospiraceae bacterium]